MILMKFLHSYFNHLKLDNLLYILISMSLFYILVPSFLNCRLQPHMRSHHGWNVGVGDHLSTAKSFWMHNNQNLILNQMLTNPRCYWQRLLMLHPTTSLYSFKHRTCTLHYKCNYSTQGQWMLLEWNSRFRLKNTVMNYSILTVYTNFSVLTEI